MIRFNEEYISKIHEAINIQDKQKLMELLQDLHPADIAALYSSLNIDEAEYIYNLLEPEVAADVLSEMDEDDRKELLSHLSKEVIAQHVIQNMDTDDAVELMRDLDEHEQEEILSHIEDIEQAGDIVDLLKYDEDTAGGLMGTMATRVEALGLWF